MRYARLNPRIQKPQFGTGRKRCFDEVAITALDDPLLVGVNELAKERPAFFERFSPWALIPGNLIQGQTPDAGAADQAVCHGAFTRARVSQKDQSHFIC